MTILLILTFIQLALYLVRGTGKNTFFPVCDTLHRKSVLILRVVPVLMTILILLASQEMWGRYLWSNSNAEHLDLLNRFIKCSENNEDGFGLKLPEYNIGEHKFLDQTIYPDEFRAFSPKQKRLFIETFYRGLGIKPPPAPKYFHDKKRDD